MRVVAGEFRGRRLRAPRGMRTRPTADRVREAVFSMLGDVTGARVLDLYAGSGALGIEALSRGAASAVFVERDPRAVAAIRENLRSLGLDEPVRRQDALRFLAHAEGPFDLVFCDPPYDSVPRVAGPLSERLPAVLAEGARMVTESDKRTPLELPFALLADRTYGDTRIAIHAFDAPRLPGSARPFPDRDRPSPDPDQPFPDPDQPFPAPDQPFPDPDQPFPDPDRRA